MTSSTEIIQLPKSPTEHAGMQQHRGEVGDRAASSELDLVKLLRTWMDHDHDGDDDESRFQWIRSQIIGGEAEIDTPFGRRRITYSDHTASGRFLGFIEGFLRLHVLPFYGNTHTTDSYVGLHTTKHFLEAKHYIKQRLGALGPHDVLLFCGTGSTAAIKRLQEVMGIAIPSLLRASVLLHLPPVDRWLVFVGPHEHHSNLLSWRESLAEVVHIGLDNAGAVDMAALEASLLSPDFVGRPKLGSFSACSNITGIYSDTRAIARVLHRHGAYACFDFACNGPYAEIEMRTGEEDGYDAIFLSPHKFIGGPGSPGILVMNDALYRIKGGPPSTSGGGTVLYVSNHDEETVYCGEVEEREDAGTPAIVQKIRAAAAFLVKEWAGGPAIRRAELRMLHRTSGRMASNRRVWVLGSDVAATAVTQQPIVSFLVYPEARGEGTRGRHLHCRFTTRLLNDLFGIQGRGGCACAGPYGQRLLGIDRRRSKAIQSAVEMGYEGIKPGWTRVSFVYYTSWKEMEFVLDAIEFVADHGRKFLPLYTFDWKTGNWEFMHHRHVLLPMKSKDEDDNESYYGKTYEDHLNFANNIVDSLPSAALDRSIPEAIDPDLVDFML
ncbi:probable cysteine desulfurase [Zingiber officinale]|uniref:probable cysteine desulfurase n=1 Tax=Zingiber officinale TaxID=94328 RepID=UPI001C4DA879|nr:probable cysteine desulfurase [Zingiber officinale]